MLQQGRGTEAAPFMAAGHAGGSRAGASTSTQHETQPPSWAQHGRTAYDDDDDDWLEEALLHAS